MQPEDACHLVRVGCHKPAQLGDQHPELGELQRTRSVRVVLGEGRGGLRRVGGDAEGVHRAPQLDGVDLAVAVGVERERIERRLLAKRLLALLLLLLVVVFLLFLPLRDSDRPHSGAFHLPSFTRHGRSERLLR